MTKHIDDPLAAETDEELRFATDGHEVPDDGTEHLPSEITYDEQRYPARPTRLRPSPAGGCATASARRCRATRARATPSS